MPEGAGPNTSVWQEIARKRCGTDATHPHEKKVMAVRKTDATMGLSCSEGPIYGLFTPHLGSYPQHVVDNDSSVVDKWNMCNKPLASPVISIDRSGVEKIGGGFTIR